MRDEQRGVRMKKKKFKERSTFPADVLQRDPYPLQRF
jgi:hypothetical protein